jgi:hypothetical protein
VIIPCHSDSLAALNHQNDGSEFKSSADGSQIVGRSLGVHNLVVDAGDDDKAVVGMTIKATKEHDVLLNKLRVAP